MKKGLQDFVGFLAFGLHMKRQPDLVVALPEGEDGERIKASELFSINGSDVLYASIEARNICAAQFIYEKNRESFEKDRAQWIHLAHKMWCCEITAVDKASGRLLSIINQKHDIFSLSSEVIKGNEIRTYDVLHVIESAIPYLETINLDGLLQLFVVQHEYTKNIMMSGRFLNELEPILISRQNDCIDLHKRISEDPCEETLGLYQLALSSLVKSPEDLGCELLLKDSTSSNELIQGASTWTLGLLLSNRQISVGRIKDVEKAIINNISSDIERVRNSSIRVAAKNLLVTNAFDELLESLAESNSQLSLCSIAESLFLNFKEAIEQPDFEKWARLLCDIDSELHGGIDNLDYILSQLIEEGSKKSLALEILSDWIIKHGQNIRRDKSVAEKFGSTTNAIMQSSDLVSQVITDWYLADDKQLAAAATGFLAELSLRKVKAVKFDCARLDELDSGDLILLVRKLIGFVSDEDYLFSLVDSLLDTKEAKDRTYGIVLELFVNEIGEDYPGSAIEFLEAAKVSETDSDRIALYSNAIQAIRSRIKELESLPRLLEMRSNPELERDLFRARAKQMSKAMEEANKGSIVEMIATKTPVKGGKGWFSYRDRKYSEISYFSHFSTEASIPRRTVTDEVGSEIKAYMMRNVSRGDE